MNVIRLALRWARTRRVALVAVLVMACGVAAMITVVALWEGVERHTIRYFRGTEGEIRVRHEAPGSLPSHLEAARRRFLEGHEEVVAIAPRMGGQGLVAPGRFTAGRDLDDTEVFGVALLGVDWEAERRVVALDRFLDQVEPTSRHRLPRGAREAPFAPDAAGRPGIVLGDRLAEKLGLEEEGAAAVVTLAVLSDAGAGRRLEERAHTSREFHLAGVFSTGLEDFDTAHAYLDIEQLADMRYARPARGLDADEIVLALATGVEGETLARELEFAHGATGWRIRTWRDAGGHRIASLVDQKRILVVILSFVTMAASAGIAGMVFTMVREKLRDIGILRSMGLSRTKIVLAFTLYGGLLGLVGCVLGLFGGLELTHRLDDIENALSRLLGVELFDAEVYQLERMPTHVEPAAVAMILLFAFATSLLAAFLPALKSGFTSPVRCLRDE